MRCEFGRPAQTFEDSHPFTGKGMAEEDQKSRRDLVNLLIKLARQLGLLEQTVHDSVLLLDRLIRRGLGIRNLTSGVLLAAVALIAAQQGALLPLLLTGSSYHSRYQSSSELFEEHFHSMWVGNI